MRRLKGASVATLATALAGAALAVLAAAAWPGSAHAADPNDPPTLVAHWTFDEANGNAAHDAVGDLTGTLHGAGWSRTAVIGSGALHVPAGAHLEIPDAPILDPAGSWTVSFWARQDAPGGLFVEKGSCDTAAAWLLRGDLDHGTDNAATGDVALGVRTAAGSLAATAIAPDQSAWPGGWHHYALARGDGALQLFIDGRAVTTWIGTIAVAFDGAGQADRSLLHLGAPDGCLDKVRAATTYDDLRVYDGALDMAALGVLEPARQATVTVEGPTSPPVGRLPAIVQATVAPAGPFDTLVVRWTDDAGDYTGSVTTRLGANGRGSATIMPPPTPRLLHITAEYAGGGAYLGAAATTTVEWGARPVTLALDTVQRDAGDPRRIDLLGYRATLSDGSPGTIYGRVHLSVTFGGEVTDLGFVTCAASTQYSIPTTSCDTAFDVHLVKGAGVHDFRATFTPGDPDSAAGVDPYVATVTRVDSYTEPAPSIFLSLQAAEPEIQAGHPVWISLNAWTRDQYPYLRTGTLEIRDEANAVLATADFSERSWIQIEVRPARPGTAIYRAFYSGNDFYGPSSASLSVSVLPNTIDASNITVSSSTIYPSVDGFRDTVTAVGTRAEPISVAISVLNARGATVRTAKVPLDTGAWSWTWNGRNAKGAIVPAGGYTIRQVLWDENGGSKTVDRSVKVSLKRIVWRTTTLYRSAGQVEKRATSWGAWKFTMPAADAYKSLKLAVYGHTYFATGPVGGFGAQDRRNCTAGKISLSCVRRGKDLHAPTDAWTTLSLVETEHSGRIVRAYAWAGLSPAVVIRFRLTVTYGVLR